jgi:hypothetical protein
VLQPDRAYSERRMVIPVPAVPVSEEGARRLGEAYWEEVAAFSRGLVRVRRGTRGVELALVRGLVLLRFGPAVTTVTESGVECRHVLAAAPGGHLILGQRASETVELSLAVQGYHPRLAVEGRLGIRRRLFVALQIPLHEGVGRRFLERAARGKL